MGLIPRVEKVCGERRCSLGSWVLGVVCDLEYDSSAQQAQHAQCFREGDVIEIESEMNVGGWWWRLRICSYCRVARERDMESSNYYCVGSKAKGPQTPRPKGLVVSREPRHIRHVNCQVCETNGLSAEVSI